MKTLKRTVHFFDRIIDTSTLIISLLLFLIGGYALLDSYLVYMNANDTDILKFKPGYESYTDLNREIEDNMVAWVTIDDTTIDYPIMQGSDNVEYLNKNPFGDYSLSGSIFLDSRNDPEFLDEYSLVYGHHVEHGSMFGALDDFLEEEFFDTHSHGELIVGDTTYDLSVFAIIEADANEEAIFAPTETEDTLPFLLKNALYLKNQEFPRNSERFVGLSTCKYPDTSDRTIVFATIKELKNTLELKQASFK